MISVIMGVYNGEKTVAKAIDSILGNTYQDLELIIVDDGSTDNTYAVLRSAAKTDNRVKVLQTETNRGLAHALNTALGVANGEWIARQDADDVSHPDRLQKQIDYLKAHPEIAFTGGAVNLVDGRGNVWGIRKYPQNVSKETVLKYNPFVHPTLLLRREAMETVNGYRDLPMTTRCEDYDLIFRLYAAKMYGGNLQDIIMDYLEERDTAFRHNFRTRYNEYRVRAYGNKLLGGGIKGNILALKPLALLFVGGKLYNTLHNRKWKKDKTD